jgi:hypothetical protein
MSAFSTAVRVLTCPQCGAPIQVSREGGHAQCNYCHAPLMVPPRDDVTTMQQAGPALTEAERYQGLWAQANAFGSKQLPPELHQVLAGGPLTPARVGAALGLWRNYCQRASAGDFAAGDNAVLLVGALSSYFVVQNDAQRRRALYESTLDALRDPAQRQVIRGLLARSSAKDGDMASARTWFATCDARSADLQADTAYRTTYAILATMANDFANVLAALGPAPNSVPVALPSRLMVDVIRANAVEKSGDVPNAIGQLVFAARSLDGGRQAIPQIVAGNAHLHLCSQSLPPAMQQW